MENLPSLNARSICQVVDYSNFSLFVPHYEFCIHLLVLFGRTIIFSRFCYVNINLNEGSFRICSRGMKVLVDCC